MMKKALSHGLVLVLIVGVVAVVSMVMMSNNNSTSYEVTGDSDYGIGYAVKQTSQPVQLNDVKYGDVVAIKTTHNKYWVSETGVDEHKYGLKSFSDYYRVTRADRDTIGEWEKFMILKLDPKNPSIPDMKKMGTKVQWGDIILIHPMRSDSEFAFDPKYQGFAGGDVSHKIVTSGELYVIAEDGNAAVFNLIGGLEVEGSHTFDWRLMQARYSDWYVGTWHEFKVVYPLDPDGKKGTKGTVHYNQPFALKTVHGRFVTGIPPNPPEHNGHLEAKATVLGPWEQFTVVKVIN
ncbi:hypothetical protein HYY69_07475 [Candidatus Woesearchaeota archaeon]|nr:hypothetical protein [Candidatus Woesearchaeota archaeon]